MKRRREIVKAKKWIIILSILLLTSCTSQKPKAEILNYKYGDTLSELVAYDFTTNKESDIFSSHTSKIVIYTSNDCYGCSEVLPELLKLSQIFTSEDVKTIYLWEDEIDKTVTKDSTSGIHYSLKIKRRKKT